MAGAPTVLLIHGFLDDDSVWDGLIDSLAGEVDAVPYDLPGFGTRSGRPLKRSPSRWSRSPTRQAGSSRNRRAGDRGRPEPRRAGRRARRLSAPRPGRTAWCCSPRSRWAVRSCPTRRSLRLAPSAVTARHSAAYARQLSPHLGEELLNRLADIGAPVAAEVTAHYANVWNTGCPTPRRPAHSTAPYSSSAAAPTGS